MPEHPILIFPTAVIEERSKEQGGGAAITRPTPAQQHTRLRARLRRIVDGFAGIQADERGLDPERVVVFETVGSVTDVARRASEIPGLEWLDEIDVDDIEPIGGFEDEADAERRLPARIFAVMTNQRAIRDLLGLWNSWRTEWVDRAPRGFGAFKDLFKNLTDIRHWGPKDRVQDTLLPWLSQLELQPDRMLSLEAELWYRRNETRQDSSEEEVVRLVESVGGRWVSGCVIPEIRYHALLLEAPAEAVHDIARQIAESEYGELVRCEDVMFLRPAAQTVTAATVEEGEPGEVPPGGEISEDAPTVALLDGLPLARHIALDGRLVIDDPDDYSASYQPGQQRHGTAMASLIVHGDLEGGTSIPLSRPIYTRPVLKPIELADGRSVERFPEDRLFLDVIHRAVRRIAEGDGEEDAVAPSVRIINLSLGNPWQPFDRNVSPLAKLLDWLSWEYDILFIVAAGNQAQPIVLGVGDEAYAAMDDDRASEAVLRAMGTDQLHRRLFSPAESTNALTVGALHADLCTELPAGIAEDVLRGRRISSPIGTVASGFRRAVKPDILMPGGRQLYNRQIGAGNDEVVFEVAPSKIKPGNKVATPGARPGDLGRYWYERGTSNATALATRWAAMILDQLFGLRDEPGGDALRDELLHVATKALLAHGAAWGNIRERIEAIARDGAEWQEERRLVARFLGYGSADLERSTIANDQRVLLLGSNQIADGEGHIYSLPLPPSLSGQKNRRRLTVTLAWMTPINPLHRDYRLAALFAKASAGGVFDKTSEVHEQLAKTGTLQHQIYESDRAVPIDGNTTIELKVNCRAAAGSLEYYVPYGLAVTLEVTDPIEADIHNEIREALRARARVR